MGGGCLSWYPHGVARNHCIQSLKTTMQENYVCQSDCSLRWADHLLTFFFLLSSLFICTCSSKCSANTPGASETRFPPYKTSAAEAVHLDTRSAACSQIAALRRARKRREISRGMSPSWLSSSVCVHRFGIPTFLLLTRQPTRFLWQRRR